MSLFTKTKIDFMDPGERDTLLLGWFRRQYAYAREHVPFFSRYPVKPEELSTLADCLRRVPRMSKGDLKRLETPDALVPVPQRSRVRYAYSTSGTTGRPAPMLLTENDWQAMLDAFVRGMPELHGLTGLKAYNGYRADHICAEVFNQGFRRMGAMPVGRKFGMSDEQALEQVTHYRCNVLLAPWTTSGKGGAFEDLLNEDARRKVQYFTPGTLLALICSSVPITDELVQELRELGIRYVYNNYGATEAGPLGLSCQKEPRDLHLTQGPHFIEVVSEDGQRVPSGGTGRVLISRISGYDDAGGIGINEGTQLLNYELGDEVEVFREPCACGRTTPRIRDIRRVKYIQEKAEGGCQVL